ncbi:MAG: hypothetical protein ACD_74C00150G0002 [uncultured bacterium]|nr:MAG: hypothetical protein ACD_74C00150G0002 [uncultured bacterium]
MLLQGPDFFSRVLDLDRNLFYFVLDVAGHGAFLSTGNLPGLEILPAIILDLPHYLHQLGMKQCRGRFNGFDGFFGVSVPGLLQEELFCCAETIFCFDMAQEKPVSAIRKFARKNLISALNGYLASRSRREIHPIAGDAWKPTLGEKFELFRDLILVVTLERINDIGYSLVVRAGRNDQRGLGSSHRCLHPQACNYALKKGSLAGSWRTVDRIDPRFILG